MKDCREEGTISSTIDLTCVGEMFVLLKDTQKALAITIPAPDVRYLLSLMNYLKRFVTHVLGEDRIAFIDALVSDDNGDAVKKNDRQPIRVGNMMRLLLSTKKACWYYLEAEQIPKEISDKFKHLVEDRIQCGGQRQSQV